MVNRVLETRATLTWATNDGIRIGRILINENLESTGE